jgi:hypothetical protein
MKITTLAAFALALTAPAVAPAQDSAPQKIKDPFVCVTHQFHVCTLYEGCRDLHPIEMNAPDFWKFDLQKKEITARRHDGTYGTVKIDSWKRLPDMLMLQGVVDQSENFPEGAAWSVAVHTQTGRASISVSAHAEVVTMLGSCHSL